MSDTDEAAEPVSANSSGALPVLEAIGDRVRQHTCAELLDYAAARPAVRVIRLVRVPRRGVTAETLTARA